MAFAALTQGHIRLAQAARYASRDNNRMWKSPARWNAPASSVWPAQLKGYHLCRSPPGHHEKIALLTGSFRPKAAVREQPL